MATYRAGRPQPGTPPRSPAPSASADHPWQDVVTTTSSLAPRALALRTLPDTLPRPEAGVPQVWVQHVRDQSAAELAAGYELLDTEERRRANAFVRQELRDRYVAAHTALRRLLGAYLEQDPGKVEFVREPCPLCTKPHGRPAVAGRPTPPLHFSLSHSDELAVLAFADRPVGADVERFPGSSTVEEVAGSLHPRERAELAMLPQDRRPAAFARVWARKEAHLKGTGAGVGGGLDGHYLGIGPLPVDPPGWTLTDLAVDSGYAACVAVASSAPPPGR